MKHRILALALALVLLLALAGCSREDLGDDRAPALVEALAAGDAQALTALFYPDSIRQEQVEQDLIPQLRDYCPLEPGAYRLTRTSWHVTRSSQTTRIDEIHTIETEQGTYQLTTTYTRDENGQGFTNLNVVTQEELAAATEVTGTLSTAGKNTPLQWAVLALWAASVGLVVFVVIDVIRRRPMYFWAWLICSFLFVTVAVRIGSGFGVNFSAGLLSQTNLLQSASGTTLNLGIPVVALVYLFMRNSLKRKEPGQKDPTFTEALWQSVQGDPNAVPDDTPEEKDSPDT